jgi:hypothetical protein
MRHRNTPDTSRENTRKRFKKEGRGQGNGKDYQGYIKPRDGGSEGNWWRLNGWKVGGREVDLLSNLERDYFYNLEADSRIVEYKEQFPLPLDVTRKIADAIGVAHPKHPVSKGDIVMTTDFVVTLAEDGEERVLARAIKPSAKLESVRILEKLEIERLYWKDRGVDWALRTERDIDREIARTMMAIHPFFRLNDYFFNQSPPSPELVEEFRTALLTLIQTGGGALSLVSAASHAARKFELPDKTGLILAKHLICTRRLPFDFRTRFEPTRPLSPETINGTIARFPL